MPYGAGVSAGKLSGSIRSVLCRFDEGEPCFLAFALLSTIFSQVFFWCAWLELKRGARLVAIARVKLCIYISIHTSNPHSPEMPHANLVLFDHKAAVCPLHLSTGGPATSGVSCKEGALVAGRTYDVFCTAYDNFGNKHTDGSPGFLLNQGLV